jgi:hypothetical protein
MAIRRWADTELRFKVDAAEGVPGDQRLQLVDRERGVAIDSRIDPNSHSRARAMERATHRHR